MKFATFVVLAICVAVLSLKASVSRNSLWAVVQACVADHALTGAPFPCLSVASPSEARDGYIVLRSPVDADTIWSPTRRVIGLEDPALRGPEAADYFLAAWNSRALIPGFGDGRDPRAVVLGINSALTRSQDQLHIHMGCATPRAEIWAIDAMSLLSRDRWTRIDARFAGRQFWARAIADDDLAHFNPFVLAAELASANALRLSNLLIATIGVRSSDARYHFLLMAGNSEQFGNGDEFDVKRLISRTCRS